MFGWFKKATAPKKVKLEWVEYNGFRVAATPISEGSQFRVSGCIEKGEGDSVQSHTFVRSDLIPSRQEAEQFSLMKGKLMIDQLGDSVFKSQ
jgi:hypothetical protein